MSRNLQASTLISLQDSKRIKVLESSKMRYKSQVISNIKHYQEWLKWDYDPEICPVWVLTEGFPSHYPDSSNLTAGVIAVSCKSKISNMKENR
jgi:hypothetical protein